MRPRAFNLLSATLTVFRLTPRVSQSWLSDGSLLPSTHSPLAII